MPRQRQVASRRSRSRSAPNNLAAIIIEPIQGEGGFIELAEGFLPALQEWATANGVVFILDEVQTGFARTGDLFAANHEGVVPDLITTAKGIAGGLPLSAVTGRAEIMDSAHAGGLGGTYAGSPIACAAALATIDIYEAENLGQRALEIGAIITEFFTELQKNDDRIGDIRGRGAMQAVELVESGTKNPAAALTGAIAKHAGERGRYPPHLRHLRQRDPLPPAAVDLRRAPPRGPADRRRRARSELTRGNPQQI